MRFLDGGNRIADGRNAGGQAVRDAREPVAPVRQVEVPQLPRAASVVLRVTFCLRVASLAIGLLCAATGPMVAGAAGAPNAGEVDRSFGVGGSVRLGGFSHTQPGGLVVDRVGRVLVADEPDGFAVRRLTAGGRDDLTFGTSGRAVMEDPALGASSAVALDGRGRILLAGQQTVRAGGGVLVARLAPDGTRDSGFGTNGEVVLHPVHASPHDFVVKVLATSDGVVVLTDGLILARLTDSGQPDSGFGNRGYVTLPVVPAHPPIQQDESVGSSSRDVVVQHDGRLVALTETGRTDGDHYDIFAGLLSRLSRSGRVVRSRPLEGSEDARTIMPVSHDGFAVIGGSLPYHDSTVATLLIRRIGNDLKARRAFGRHGSSDPPPSLRYGGFDGFDAVLSHHRYVVATSGGLLRFDARGHLDRSYGRCGVASLPNTPSAIDAPGSKRIITLTSSNSSPAAARLLAVGARGHSDPAGRPQFGPLRPYVVEHNTDYGPTLRTLARGRAIRIAVETPQRATLTATLRTAKPVTGLPRLLARLSIPTMPCVPSIVALRLFPGVRHAMATVRKHRHKDVHAIAQITLHTQAGTRTSEISYTLSRTY